MQVSLTPRAERWSPQGRGAFTYCPLLGSIPAAGREKRGQSPPPGPMSPQPCCALPVPGSVH